VDSVTANRELKGLVQEGLINQQGTRRWAYYKLSVSDRIEQQKTPKTNEEKILAYVREHGSINNTECRGLLGVDSTRAWYLLRKLIKKGKLVDHQA